MESVWSKTCEIEGRDALHGDLETEVAVIGGGMAGVLIAHALQDAGMRVVILEADRIAGGQIRNTTAKITAQHGIIYHKLMDTFGEEKAAQYAKANLQAVQRYRRLIQSRNISCDFEECPSYVYGTNQAQLEQEAKAAKALGLPASYVENIPIPVPAVGAVRFDGQAQFHPLKFIKALSTDLTIYEHTTVQEVEENLLITNRGKVKTKHIVFACHFPFVNFPGMYFSKMYQERSYVLALEGASSVEGMWIGGDEERYSLRNYNGLLLFGGGQHRAGENREGGRYDLLREKAQQWFPGSVEVACWSAQDCMTPDSVPYIGQYAPSRPNWYVATGFGKWGMTTSMAASEMLRDMILEKENPYASVFAPSRFEAEAITGMAAQGGQAVKGLIKRFFQIPAEAAAEISPGHGGIVTWKGQKVGVYKDDTEKLHPVDIRCPHLGCQLEWNPDEKSWDCPCHGSRFDYHGRLISGPAQEHIARKEEK